MIEREIKKKIIQRIKKDNLRLDKMVCVYPKKFFKILPWTRDILSRFAQDHSVGGMLVIKRPHMDFCI